MRAYAAGIVNDTKFPNTLRQLEAIIINILGVATSLVGLAVFAMFILGAFRLATAGSNQENAQKARQTFTYAAIGAAALILVWFLFVFLKEYTGFELLKFKVCIVEDQYCFIP